MPDAPAPGFRQNPDYPMAVAPFLKRVRTSVAGIVIADSRNAKLLRENTYPGVFYFPKDDVRIDGFLAQTDLKTTCPYKGDAGYWTFRLGSQAEENIAWSYADPYREAADIAGHLSFYWDRMDCWFVDDAQIARPPV
ncbi:MAG: DUF427 domain-containing protein [Rhodospirillaceae bacterium]